MDKKELSDKLKKEAARYGEGVKDITRAKDMKKKVPLLPDHANAVYIEEDVDTYNCHNCVMFMHGENRCTTVEGEIMPHGSCNIWVKGKYDSKEHKETEVKLGRREVGYIEASDGMYSCSTCPRFKSPTTCVGLSEPVKSGGCCNFWTSIKVKIKEFD